MFDVANLVQDKEIRALLLIAGAVGSILVARHYYYQIKLAKLKMEAIEQQNTGKIKTSVVL